MWLFAPLQRCFPLQEDVLAASVLVLVCLQAQSVAIWLGLDLRNACRWMQAVINGSCKIESRQERLKG